MISDPITYLLCRHVQFAHDSIMTPASQVVRLRGYGVLKRKYRRSVGHEDTSNAVKEYYFEVSCNFRDGYMAMQGITPSKTS